MESFFVNLLGRNKSKTVQALLFFLIFYLYLWLVVQPNLIYHGGGRITNFPIFNTGTSFLNEIFWHPGGPVKYLSAFLAQFLIFSPAGALVLTLHAILFYVFTCYFLKKAGIAWYNILSLIPPVLLLITYNSYNWHFTAFVALLAALIVSCIYIKAAPINNVASVFLFIFCSVVLYLLATDASLFFIILCAAYEVFLRRRWLVGIVASIPSAFAGFFMAGLIFNIRPKDFYSKFLPYSKEITSYSDPAIIPIVYTLFLFLPLLVVVIGIWRRSFEKVFQFFLRK